MCVKRLSFLSALYSTLQLDNSHGTLWEACNGKKLKYENLWVDVTNEVFGEVHWWNMIRELTTFISSIIILQWNLQSLLILEMCPE